ncbi:MAG: AsmA family protein [Desulfobacterales bacterium]|nr:MAG: AsmA family protein [Desulfobacterales bacterium]
MRWKWILGTFAVVVIGLFVSISIIVASYDYNKLKPKITQAVKKATGRELTLGGEIDLKIGLRPKLAIQNVAFQNAPWGSEPQMAILKRLEVQIALFPLIKGDILVRRLILVDPKFMLEINKSGESNLEFETSKEAKPKPKKEKENEESKSVSQVFMLNEIIIHKAQLIFKDHHAGRTQTLNLDKLILKTKVFGKPADIEMNGAYNKIPFSVSGSLGALNGLMDPAKPWPVELTAQAMNAKISLKGTIKDPLSLQGIDLNVNLQAENLASFEKTAGEPLPVKGPFRLSGHIVASSPKIVKISEFSAKLSDSQMNGLIAIDQSAKRPRIEAKLSSERLDLRLLMAQDQPVDNANSQSAKTKSKPGKVFSSTPLQLDALNQFDASIHLRITQLLLPRIAIENMDTNVNLENGHLKIQPFDATIGDGKLTGNLDLNARNKEPTLATLLKIEELDLGNMLKDLDITDAADGKINADIRATSRGNSVAALMAELSGHTQVLMSEGLINTRYIKMIGADLRASLFRLFNPLKEKQQFAQINCFVCRFNIENGMADSKVFLMDTNRMTVAGVGQINLKTEQLNFGLQPKPKEGIGTETTGKVSVSLSEFAKPFRLGGTLANPALAIDTTQTALTLGKTLGSMALFGPLGIVTTMVSKESGTKHPCTAALEAVKQEDNVAKEKTREEKESTSEKKSGGIGSKLKKLFGKPDN